MRIALPWVTLLALLAGCPSNPAVDDDDDAVDDDDTVESQDPREGFCDPGTEIAYVRLINYGKTTTVLAEAFDAPDVTIGTPALVAGDCAYHVHDRAACGGCDLGDVCSQTGGCVVRRSPVLGSTIAVTIDGVEQNFEANEFGQIWSDLGPITTDIETSLSWDGTVASAPAWSPPTGDIGPVVAVSGEWDAPGELIVTWTDQGESALVRSTRWPSLGAWSFRTSNTSAPMLYRSRGAVCSSARRPGSPLSRDGSPTPPAAVPDARGGPRAAEKHGRGRAHLRRRGLGPSRARGGRSEPSRKGVHRLLPVWRPGPLRRRSA